MREFKARYFSQMATAPRILPPVMSQIHRGRRLRLAAATAFTNRGDECYDAQWRGMERQWQAGAEIDSTAQPFAREREQAGARQHTERRVSPDAAPQAPVECLFLLLALQPRFARSARRAIREELSAPRSESAVH